jgi:NADH-quinone oxidoreductase subunit D
MAVKTETYVLNMGPQHPSTHGVLQVRLELDGERIIKATPVMGYLHRGIEKLMESRTYTQCIPYTDKLDYVSAMNNNLAYCETVEKLAGIEVPERAEYIRVIVAELNRIASHLIFFGTLLNDLGAATAFIYAFRDREKILDLFNLICGARMSFSYMRIGGVAADAQPEFLKAVDEFLAYVPKMLKEYDDLVTGNEIFWQRMKGVSKLSASEAKKFNMSGPNLRASGVPYDIRRVEPYSIYDRFAFEVPVGTVGDDWDRYEVRMREIAESAKIIRQALDSIPAGPFQAKVPAVIRPPKGDVYHRVENTRGELGFYIVSDGTNKPYRVHIRRPSFVNMQALDTMCRGMLIADSVVVYSTIDPLMGETDC